MSHRRIVALALFVLAPAIGSLTLTRHAPGQSGWYVSRTPTTLNVITMTYDVLRERVVMVTTPPGPGTHVFQTWEWDGSHWHQRGAFPQVVNRGTIYFDWVRARCSFLESGAPLRLWEWDGLRWSPRFCPGPPPVSSWMALAYDHLRSRLVLFGGVDANGKPSTDTWEWDGQTWTRRAPSRNPPATPFGAMAFDSRRARAVWFGGAAETWEWDGNDWHPMAPSQAPPSPLWCSLAYDWRRGRVVLCGETSPNTWEWDGKDWHSISGSLPAGQRAFTQCAYDIRRGVVVHVLGSYDKRTWTWDGSNWVDRSPTEELSAVGGQRLAYSPPSGRVLSFGGRTDSELWNSTFEWDGRTWRELQPATRPAARMFAALATDTSRGRIVMFGGLGVGGTLQDTWEWDGVNWHQRTPPGAIPPPRAEHAMAYDSVRKRVVLYGGVAAYPNYNAIHYGDTWEWDGQSWTRLNPASRPGIRRGHVMAYDEARQRVVFFGGVELTNTNHMTTWEWDGVDWRQAASAGPLPRVGAGMVYNTDRRRVQMFGGLHWGTARTLDDLWEWDGQSWGKLATAPVSSTDHGIAFDPNLQRIVISGQRTLWYGDHVDTVSASYGNGCTGSALGPVLLCDEPWISHSRFALGVYHGRPASPCVFGLSAGSRTLALGGGCSLYLADPMVPIGVSTNSDGTAVLPLGLPYDRTLRGITLYAQGFVTDPQGPILGLTFTSGRKLVVGD